MCKGPKFKSERLNHTPLERKMSTQGDVQLRGFMKSVTDLAKECGFYPEGSGSY